MPKEVVQKGYYNPEKLGEFELSGALVDVLFGRK
jgi:hypothetical protein